jgi:hypothetical protein
VVRGSDTLLMKGYGKADLEWDASMTSDAVFEIGSVTKRSRAPPSCSCATRASWTSMPISHDTFPIIR